MELNQKPSQPDSGHARNIANLADLTVRCIGFGGVFNPGKPELQISALQQLLLEAQSVLQRVADAEATEKIVVDERKELFKQMRSMSARIINMLIACGVSAKKIADARSIQYRIAGKRKNKKRKTRHAAPKEVLAEVTNEMTAENGVVTAPKTISVSRQSYDLLVEHFAKLVLLVQYEPTYTVNEVELQVSTLQSFVQQLRDANKAVKMAESETAAARMQRTRVLYDKTTGLVQRAKQVKSYIKALFGSKSGEYKQISKLPFRTFK